MFHSRRIGQRPGRIALPRATRSIEQPEQTTILGAAKVTGKASGWTYGGLTALTDREYATVDATTVDGAGREQVVTHGAADRAVYLVQRGSRPAGCPRRLVERRRDRDRRGAREATSMPTPAGSTTRFAGTRTEYTWNGHWVGTHAPIDDVVKTGFGGVTNFNYESKHFGVFGHYDYFDRYFKNTDIGFFASRNNKTAVDAGFNIRQPDPTKYFRRCRRVHERRHPVQRRRAPARQKSVRRQRGAVPELLGRLHGRRPQRPRLRRSRYTWRSADRESRRVVLQLLRRVGLSQDAGSCRSTAGCRATRKAGGIGAAASSCASSPSLSCKPR